MAVFSIAVSIIFQASKHFWNGVSTDFLYKNVTKDFAVNENFIIYASPFVVAVAALHHYCGLQVQIKRNKKIWRKYRLSCIFRFILRLVLKLQMAMLIASCWLFFMAYLPPLGRISRVQSRMTLVAFTPVWVNEPRRKNWFCFVEFLWNSVESYNNLRCRDHLTPSGQTLLRGYKGEDMHTFQAVELECESEQWNAPVLNTCPLELNCENTALVEKACWKWGEQECF